MIKFRAWNPKNSITGKDPFWIDLNAEGIYLGQTSEDFLVYGHGGWAYQEAIIQQFTNLLDVNKKEIYEGDIVVVYPAQYERTLVEDNIYFLDTTKPLPVKDIVFYRGVVERNGTEFRVTVEENENGVASVGMTEYWFEIVGNIFENP